MSKYTKSHSNFRLAQLHQSTQNGKIYERDITTLGGINTFSTGQTTIYSSGNFIITTGTSNTPVRNISKSEWVKNSYSGNVWTTEVLKNQSSDIEASIESNIGIKKDYIDLKNFGYYGSLLENIKNSITNIFTKYPYEIYTLKAVSTDTYYDSKSDSFLKYSTTSNDTLYGVSNPGGIDIHGEIHESLIKDPLKYFSNGGYANYVIIDDKENITKEHKFTYKVTPNDASYEDRDVPNCSKPGDYIAEIVLTREDNKSYSFYAFVNDNNELFYLCNEASREIHIRPNLDLGFYEDYISSLNTLQKAIIGYYSGVRNQAKFLVYSETERGFEPKLEIFNFPFGAGGYNIGSDSDGMAAYVNSLTKIATMYDEYFSDNLYRTMTHESIKNFDWTKGLNGDDSNSNTYIENGNKMKNIIHIMGYQFDEELDLINSIENCNTITYNNQSNLSDYFLTDSLENDSWDLQNIYPYDLTIYDRISGSDVDYKKVNWNNTNDYGRRFSEINSDILTPYLSHEGPYYLGCANDVSGYTTTKNIELENDNGQSFIPLNNGLANVIRCYSSEDEYTSTQINNAFMKRLRINSKHLLRKKGTKQGIDSMLSLFGMKNREWIEKYVEGSQYNKNKINNKYNNSNFTKKLPYDYELKEYTLYTLPIIDEWKEGKDNYQIDYYNSCKTISYYSAVNAEYSAYQGLPVTYRDSNSLWYTNKSEITDDENNPDILTNSYGNPVKVRYLYPDFENEGEYDGNPYYQMNGGWMSMYPYKFSPNGDLVLTSKSTTYKETLRNVNQVNNLLELINTQSSFLSSGIVYYVIDVDTDYAVIDGFPYELHKEVDNDGNTLRYFNVEVYNNMINIGSNLYNGYLEVSNPYISTNIATYVLDSFEDGSKIKIYLKNDADEPFYIYGYTSIENITTDDVNTSTPGAGGSLDDSYIGSKLIASLPNTAEGAVIKKGEIKPETMSVFMNGKQDNITSGDTHYFKLVDAGFNYILGGNGWNQLVQSDPEYARLSSVNDYYSGNNPHSGNFIYDNGYSYLGIYSRLFGFAIDNELFDTSCFDNVEAEMEKLESIGFKYLNVDAYNEYGDYGKYLHFDTKIHSFLDIMEPDGNVKKYSIDGASDKNHYALSDIIGYEYLANDPNKNAYNTNSSGSTTGGTIVTGTTTGGTIFTGTTTGGTIVTGTTTGGTITGSPTISQSQETGESASGSYAIEPQSVEINGAVASGGSASDGSDAGVKDENFGSIKYSVETDGVTNRLINTKVFEIILYIWGNDIYTKESQEQVKYLQDKVLPYVEQMIPSSAICLVKYKLYENLGSEVSATTKSDNTYWT